jgi:hypothetical protein
MKNFQIAFVLTVLFLSASCDKDEDSERYDLLTGNVWQSENLLVNGVDASGPSGMLENFKGDVKFNTDGTGSFGAYTGTWSFNTDETKLNISTTALPFTLIADIEELTSTSLKITTIFPNLLDASNPYNIRMTFKAK